MKDTKAFLKKIRHEQREILDLQREIKYLEKSLLPGGIRYDLDKVQTSPSDKVNDILAKVGDYKAKIETKLAVLLDNENKALRMIDGLESSAQRRVLKAYYLSSPEPTDDLPTWDDVAATLHFSIQRVHQHHGDALEILNAD